MKIAIGLITSLFIAFTGLSQQNAPDKIYGQLFIDVQLQKIFPDGKTFVDCIPKRNVKDIMYDYGMQKGKGFNLLNFVENNFIIPKSNTQEGNQSKPTISIIQHINQLWPLLNRNADSIIQGSSLLPLPFSYIVPGGRFREMYYWDSYFTMLGLKESKKYTELENMVKNFAYLLDTYGHIPNGTRTYYLGRSQPPFFSMMVELLSTIKGKQTLLKYLPQLQKEYNYFMQGAEGLQNGEASKYVVKTVDGYFMNRYWDEMNIPRQESYAEDVETANKACDELTKKVNWATQNDKEKALDSLRKLVYKNIRAAACSGLDFSNKWFADDKTMATIHTIDFIAVDLNALLLNLEIVLANAYKLKNDLVNVNLYNQKSKIRVEALIKYCWNKELNFFTDYDFVHKTNSKVITPMGMFPFSFINTTTPTHKAMAQKAAFELSKHLLKKGGLQCTINSAGQQWDAPNGWAPMQWMSIVALERFNQKVLAKQIANRWISINKKVYSNTGKLMEKYNVVDVNLLGGGGEYPGQDGFGWTNGVLLALMSKYN